MAVKLIYSSKVFLAVALLAFFINCSDSSKGSTTTLLGAPILLDVSTTTPTSFMAKWLGVSGATSYLIDVATDANFTTILTAYNGQSITGEAFEVTNLAEKATYYIRLKASNGTSQSDFSNVKSATTSATVSLSELLVTVAALDRKFYSAKHELATGILHGAGQDIGGFKDYAVAVGKPQHPIIYMTYVGLTGTKAQVESWGVQLKNELASLPKDIIPQIGLNMTGGKDTGAGQTVEIARGDYDVQIVAFAQAVKDLGRKSFVRIGYEFEGSWNGYNTQGYVDSFIKITNELRRIDANAATVWCSGGGSAGFMSWDKLVNFYPGDAYVDWFGVDIFSPEELTDGRLFSFLNKADEFKKPVMIGETTPRYVGTLDGKTSWDKWFRPFFGLLYSRPQIKAICYINWDWAYWSQKLGFSWSDWKDGRIEKNETVMKGYIQEIKKPIFVHSVE
jgi:hypothetical protein